MNAEPQTWRLRAEVESLRADLLATAQNLTQAERDRDVNGEALSRAQRERGEALRDLEALKNVVQSIARVANQAVTS